MALMDVAAVLHVVPFFFLVDLVAVVATVNIVEWLMSFLFNLKTVRLLGNYM